MYTRDYNINHRSFVQHNVEYFFIIFIFFFVPVLFSRPPLNARRGYSKSLAAPRRGSRADAIPPCAEIPKASTKVFGSFQGPRGAEGAGIAISGSSRPQYSPQTTRPHMESRRKRVYIIIYAQCAAVSRLHCEARILYTLCACSIMCRYICRTRTRLL